jgi:hypothetical protein
MSPEEAGPGLDSKLKHLEFIQAVIARMSNSSFLFKGWAVTIAAALTTFAATDTKVALRVALIAAMISTALFWALDGYYLWLERGFVKLHQQVAAKDPSDIDFSMTIDKSDAFCNWLRTCRRFHLALFYGVIIAVDFIGMFVIRSK